MVNYILSCCSTADLSKEHFEARSIRFVCFHYLIDGLQYDDDLGQSMSFDEFYKRIEQGAQPTTAQVNVAQYNEFFGEILSSGYDVLHISLSSGLSGSYNAAMLSAGEMREKYPDRRIEIIDSLGASSGYGLLMETLADMRDEGASLDELITFTEENKLKLHHWFFSTDLTSFIRGGRVTKTAGFIGQMLNICPLLNMDRQGHLIPREKHRTKRKVIEEIVKKMEEHACEGTGYSGKCFISHSACLEDAQAVAALVEQTFPQLCGKVLINNIGTVIGSHTGPGTVALYFFGDERE